ncbi:hypothetical protein [Streptomyces lydicus]|uniref:hypothetical protein n=1 Tax=Streptomyces lydicus TaxID=47763 RepID=UPI0037F3A40B
MDDATRSWLLAQLGTNTNLADLDARYTRLGRARAVAIEILNQRKADLINNQPASVNISSVLSVTYTENIKAIERQLALLEATDAPPAPDESTPVPEDDSDSRFGIIRLIERRRR